MRLLSCVVLAGGIVLISHGAAAQDPGEDVDAEGAHFLLRQGLELVEQGDWSRAADRFRTALRMDPSPTLRYHLAQSLFELGQLNEAEELVVAIRGDSEAPDDIRRKAAELAERIPTVGGSLTIRVDGADDVELFLDDRAVPPSRMERPMTASIGGHVVEARRNGAVVAREDVTVSRDTPADVTLRVVTHADFILGGEEPTEEEGSSLFGDWRFWAIVGGGVVAVAVIVAIIAMAASTSRVEEPIVGTFQPGVLTWE